MEALDLCTTLDYLATDIAAQYCRIFFDEKARLLDLPVDRIDGNGVVLDQDLVAKWTVAGGFLDDEGVAFGFFDPLRLVSVADMERLTAARRVYAGNVLVNVPIGAGTRSNGTLAGPHDGTSRRRAHGDA